MKKLFVAFLLALPGIVFGQDTVSQPGRTILSVHTAYCFSEDLHQDFGLGVAYERIMDKNWKWGLSLPLTLGFSRDKDFMGFFSWNNNSNKTVSYPSCSFAPGIKWYAGRKSGKVKYSLGPSLYFETGQSPNFSGPDASNSHPVGTVNYNVLGYMITNSLDVYVTRQFCVGAFLGTGFATVYNGQRLSALIPFKEMGPGVLYQCILKVGYRF